MNTRLLLCPYAKKIILLITMMFSWVCLFFSKDDAAVVHILLLLVIVIVSSMLVGFELYHPSFLFPVCFFLYSVTYSILLLMGEVTDYGYSKKTIGFEMLGLCVFLLVIPFHKIRINDFGLSNIKQYSSIYKFDLCLVLINTIIMFGVIAILFGEYQGKKDIYANGGLLLNLIFKIAYFSIVFFIYSLFFKLKNKIKVKYNWFIFCELVIIILGVVSGERNYVFHILLATVICYSVVGKIDVYRCIAICIVGALILPLSASFKYFVLRGTYKPLSVSRILVDFLNGEFKSAGKNLQILVSDGKYNYYNGKGIINEFLRVFFDTGFSHSKWFNSTYYSNVESGQGFTIVGAGYLNGGWIGIVIVFIIISVIYSVLYRNAIKNDYYMTLYIYMSPLFLYSIRQDLAAILSPLVKYAILGTIIIAIFNEIISSSEGYLEINGR